MKRKRVPTTVDTQKGNREAENEEIQISGPSIKDLPQLVIVKIMLRLPMNTLLVCRCVCKNWRNVISDSHFAELHYRNAPVCVIFRTKDLKHVSRTLYLAKFEHDNIDMEYCSHKSHHSDCSRYMKRDTKLKLLLRDAKMVLNTKYNVKPNSRDHKFGIVNSCNGFLCLFEPKQNDPVLVCNPITGEFIKLPEASKVGNSRDVIEAGFGFSPRTNQYKVIRTFSQYTCHPISGKKEYDHRVAEIHTLGSGSWTSVGCAPLSLYGLKFPTYLSGALHWFGIQDGNEDFIVSFDVHNEKFDSFPSFPSLPYEEYQVPYESKNKKLISMGVLEDSLCICDASGYCPIDIWVMKEYGVKESWTRMFSIDVEAYRWPTGLYQPIKYLNNGGILLYHAQNFLFCSDSATNESKYLKLRGSGSNFEAAAYIPSLISLKHAVMGDTLEVLNVKSSQHRCAQFKLREEVEASFLVEEYMDLALYFRFSSEER